MYNRTLWRDHGITPDHTYRIVQNADGTVTATPAGRIIQQGTNMSAENFNNMETGIFSAAAVANEAVRVAHELQRVTTGLVGEAIDVVLTSTQKYPFNNSVKSVALGLTRNNSDYTVTAEVISAVGGGAGEISVTEKLRNGFKIAYTGAASTVNLRVIISGGI